MKEIELTQGKVAIVDDEDFEYISQWKWCYHSAGYAVRAEGKRGKQVHIYMHREILKPPSGMFTDHVNGDRLDNRKINLRSCNDSQNASNKGLQKNNTSGYKGASWCNKYKKWLSSITFTKNRRVSKKFLGYFKSAEAAARAYDKAAREKFGEFARLNFPEVE